MLRLRSIPAKAGIEATWNRGDNGGQVDKEKMRKRSKFSPPLPLILIVVWCTALSVQNCQYLLDKNLGLLDDPKAWKESNLRSTSKSIGSSFSSGENENRTMDGFGDVCPALPHRLLHASEPPPLVPLTREQAEVQRQIMVKTHFGTMGDTILQCPPLPPPTHHSTSRRGNPETECRGILKTYRTRTVYEHVKRALTILADTGIVPRILYSDDATLTLVEESKGKLTMMNSQIPVDFDHQLRRILCILRRHKIVHRDVTFPNFVVDEATGMVYLIDFGDAFLGTEGGIMANLFPSWRIHQDRPFNWRNVENLLNIWLSSYDEERRLEELIATARPKVSGERQWRPKPWKWTTHSEMKMGSLLVSAQIKDQIVP
jgi:hypothetical protein